MVEVTRLNGSKITVNPFLVEYMEETPDTLLIFNSGHKMVIKEKTAEVRELFASFLGEAIGSGILKSK